MIDQQQLDRELAELEGKLRCYNHVWDEDREDYLPQEVPANAEEWNELLGDITPKQLWARMARAGGPDNTIVVGVNLQHDEERRADIKVRHNSAWEDGHHDNVIRFSFGEQGHAYMDQLYLRPEDQNQGTAKRYMWEGAKLLKDMGFKYLHVDATETGAYTSIKFGFIPEDANEWDLLRNQLRKRLQDNDKIAIPESIYDPELKRVQNVNYTADITRDEKEQLEAILNNDELEPSEALQLLTTFGRTVGMFKGQPITVSKALLFNSVWSGILPLDEHDPNFQRFAGYVGHAPTELRERG